MTRQNSRPPRMTKQVRKRSKIEKQQIKQRFSTEIEVLSRPVPTSRIYRETDLQIHAKALCAVGEGTQRDEYVVHFVRERTANEAMNLRPGDRVRIEEATFNEFPPRSGKVEIHARAFRRL